MWHGPLRTLYCTCLTLVFDGSDVFQHGCRINAWFEFDLNSWSCLRICKNCRQLCWWGTPQVFSLLFYFFLHSKVMDFMQLLISWRLSLTSLISGVPGSPYIEFRESSFLKCPFIVTCPAMNQTHHIPSLMCSLGLRNVICYIN